MSDQDCADTLVHEVNHYLNEQNEEEDVFNRELRAHVVEKLCQNTPLLRSKVQSLAKKVAKSYRLELPEKVTLPAGVYFPALSYRHTKRCG